MLIYVPFEDIGPKQIERLAKSLLAAPAESRPTPGEYITSIRDGTRTLFEWDKGIALVGQRGQRLVLYACQCDDLLHEVLPFVEDLKKIAAEWECHTIETIVFDPRLASVIRKLGGALESQLMTLPVE